MNDEKEKWIAEVFQSMQGSQRAQPGPELFEKINAQLMAPRPKVIPMSRLRYAAAAAILLLFLNTSALFYYNNNQEIAVREEGSMESYSQSLISSYQIYEK